MMKSKVGVFLSTVLVVAVSCNKEFKDLSTDSSTTANNEVVSESYSGDVEDLSAVAVSTDPNAGGRELSINSIDDRFSCATITRTAGAEVNEGTILIDFGSGGCKDSKGNVRKGSIKITYKGKRYAPGSSCKTELIDYYINDLKVEGTR